jgi:hypothetical protein
MRKVNSVYKLKTASRPSGLSPRSASRIDRRPRAMHCSSQATLTGSGVSAISMKAHTRSRLALAKVK